MLYFLVACDRTSLSHEVNIKQNVFVFYLVLATKYFQLVLNK